MQLDVRDRRPVADEFYMHPLLANAQLNANIAVSPEVPGFPFRLAPVAFRSQYDKLGSRRIVGFPCIYKDFGTGEPEVKAEQEPF